VASSPRACLSSGHLRAHDGDVVTVLPPASEVEVVAHRGASALAPEHTLAAYRQALELGADAVECDVRMTSDGVLVCVHDRRINRTSTGRGVVSALSLADLEQHRFVHRRRRRGGAGKCLVCKRPRARRRLPGEGVSR